MKFSYLFGLFFILMASTSVSADSQGEAQELLGKAIQDAAQVNFTRNSDEGMSQEQLGLAIQHAAVTLIGKDLTVVKDQEHLGRLIRDSASLSYAHGALQQEMGKTIVGLSQG